MDWFRDNKFVGIWLVLTLLITLLLGFLLFRAFGAYKAARGAYTSNENAVTTLERGKPYPNAENVDTQKENAKLLRNRVEELRENLVEYQRPFAKIPPADLQKKILAKVNMLKERAKTSGVKLHNDFDLDLGRYISQPPKDVVAGPLDFQVDSLVWLAEQMIDSRISSIDKVDRTPLPVEDGRASTPEPTPAPTRGRGRNAAAVVENKPPVVERFPVEISFTGRMGSVEEALNRISNAGESTDFFHVIRLVRFENTNASGPTRIEREEEPAFDAGAEFVAPPDPIFANEGDEGKEDASVILGKEEVRVFLQIDLCRFATEPIVALADEETEAKPADAATAPTP